MGDGNYHTSKFEENSSLVTLEPILPTHLLTSWCPLKLRVPMYFFSCSSLSAMGSALLISGKVCLQTGLLSLMIVSVKEKFLKLLQSLKGITCRTKSIH